MVMMPLLLMTMVIFKQILIAISVMIIIGMVLRMIIFIHLLSLKILTPITRYFLINLERVSVGDWNPSRR